jgi:hypothetical protein
MLNTTKTSLRYSRSYIGTIDFSNQSDLDMLAKLKDFVYNQVNQYCERKLRIVVRGRQPKVKMVAPQGYCVPGSVGPVKYNYHGNIVGGIQNATQADIYIYKR